MKKTRNIISIMVSIYLLLILMSCQQNGSDIPKPDLSAQSIKNLIVDNAGGVVNSGIPLLVEFGRGTCVECNKMEPILDSVAAEYQDKLYVAKINVDDYYNLAIGSGIRAIPTQIFYDGNGKEIYRHVGFFAKKYVISQLKKMGIE